MLGRPLLEWDVSVRCEGGGKRVKRPELPACGLDATMSSGRRGPVASYLWNMAPQHRLS